MAGMKRLASKLPKPPWYVYAYLLLGFILPGFLDMFSGRLPFVNTLSFSERLVCAVLIATLVFSPGLVSLKRAIVDQTELDQLPADDPVSDLKRGFAALLGICVFGGFSAYLSANILGPLAHLLPKTPYQDVIQLERVWLEARYPRGGYGDETRARQWYRVEMRSEASGSTQYVELSPRFLKVPYMQSGDTVDLYGWRTVLGVYVTKVEPRRASTELEGEEE